MTTQALARRLGWLGILAVVACDGSRATGSADGSDNDGAGTDGNDGVGSDGSTDAPGDGGAGETPADAVEEAPAPGPLGAWSNRTPTSLPPEWPLPRYASAMAFDPERKVVVMFGGDDGGLLHDTQEWNGSVWTERTPTTGPNPPGSSYHGLLWDRDRKRVVLAGGTLGDAVWEWDGGAGTWAQRIGGGAFGPDLGPVFAYDEARKRTVRLGHRALGDELWEWDGATATWETRTPSPRPAGWVRGRRNAGVAYDVGTGKTLFFGGIPDSGGAYSNDLWEWDGLLGTWKEIPTSTLPDAWPTPRWSHAAVFDARREVMLVFGGHGSDFRDDLWEWWPRLGTWVKRAPAPRPSSWPAARDAAAAAFDSARQVLVIFGGENGPVLRDLWEYTP